MGAPSRGSRRLIVNADDFGLTAGVNRAIEDAHMRGVLTSTTALVGRPEAEAAGDLVRRHPQLDVGVHVNLTLGRPLSDPSRVRTLVDADGDFLPVPALLKRVALRRVDPAEVRREVEAQIVRLRSFGVSPVHWDSHQAMAFWPGLIGPAAAAAQAGGLRCARCPRVWVVEPGRRPTEARWHWRLAHPARRTVTELARVLGRRTLVRRFCLPDWRLSPGLVTSGNDYRARWAEALANVPPGASEIVSHPGYVDEELRKITPRLTDDRAVDLAVLTEAGLGERLAASGVELVGFRALVS